MKTLPIFLIIFATLKPTYSAGCNKEGTDLKCTNITFAKEVKIPYSSDVSSIKNLIISDNLMPYVPLGVFSRFYKVDFLDLRRNKVNTIEPGAFNGMSNLKKLWLDVNDITEIKPATFNSVANLEEIDLRHNKLTVIDKNYFSKMHRMFRLYLLSNQIVNVTENALEGLISLTYLTFDNNLLENLPMGCFRDLGNLTTLNLGSNLLASFDSGLFTGLNKLQYLYLSNNRLTEIDASWFVSLGQLSRLDLDRNKISNLNTTSFSYVLPNLKEMQLNKNKWTCSSLFEVTVALKRRQVNVLDNHTISDTNILGIGCENKKPNDNLMLDNKTEHNCTTPKVEIQITDNVTEIYNTSSSLDLTTAKYNTHNSREHYYESFSSKMTIQLAISALILLVLILFLLLVVIRSFVRAKENGHYDCTSLAVMNK